MPPASAIVLAGGESRRMGRPKAALPFGGRTILERIIDELRRDFDDLIVAAAPIEGEPFDIAGLLGADRRVRLIRDDGRFQGPAGALARGLRAARHEIAFACSCDLPLIRGDVALALCGMTAAHDAAIPEVGGRLQPLYAAYRRRSRAAIERGIGVGERRLTALVAALDIYRVSEAELLPLDPGLASFLNVNTPEDYVRASRAASAAAGPVSPPKPRK
jgi:molybdopterin-guanine dinucleotide biosynthesis protein A